MIYDVTSIKNLVQDISKKLGDELVLGNDFIVSEWEYDSNIPKIRPTLEAGESAVYMFWSSFTKFLKGKSHSF